MCASRLVAALTSQVQVNIHTDTLNESGALRSLFWPCAGSTDRLDASSNANAELT